MHLHSINNFSKPLLFPQFLWAFYHSGLIIFLIISFEPLVIASQALSIPSLTGSRFILSYIAVVFLLLCPSVLPIIAVVVPVIACQLPSVLLKSCILKSFIPARSNILAHPFFGSSKCPLLLVALGNTHFDFIPSLSCFYALKIYLLLLLLFPSLPANSLVSFLNHVSLNL